jgi:signal peptidase
VVAIRRLAKALLLLPTIAVCWLLLPTLVGGPTSYILVDGQSMEPLLFTGDLAVTSRLRGHDAGDLTVFDIGSNQLVIHRLIERAPNGEWITQGDNKPAPDPWTVPDSAIVGTYVFGVTGAGEKIAWLKARPLAVAFFAGVLVMASYLPFRPVLPRRWRKSAPTPDEGGAADSNEWSVIFLAFAGAFACVIVLMSMVRQNATWSPLAGVLLALTLVSGSAGVVLLVSQVVRRRRGNRC